MYRNRQNFYGNPWYRGYMPRSYIPPHCIASFGCSIYLIGFGIFFLIGGTIATVMSKHVAASGKSHYEDPRFQDPFFKDSRERSKAASDSMSNIMQTIGIILISVGAIFIISAITICCFARHYMKKYENKRQNVSAPLSEGSTEQVSSYPPPPPGSYPQQPAPPPGSYPQQPAPPPGSYPQYPVPAAGSYPQQYAPESYPQQPVTTPISYPPQSVPHDSYPYSPTTQSATSESQMSNANPPPLGFKE